VKSAEKALTHISTLRNVPMSQLIIPTQQRYIGYVTSMLERKLPNTSPVCTALEPSVNDSMMTMMEFIDPFRASDHEWYTTI
jgi:hypothetical protein